MGQFFLVSTHGEIAAQDVVNTFAFWRSTNGLPTDVDNSEIANYVDSQILDKIAAMSHNSLTWHSIMVQAYRDTWIREPYLPFVKSITKAGSLTGTACIPLIALTLSFKVQPVANGPTGLPVRRGYIHLAGMSEAFCLPTGMWDPTLLTHVGLTAIRSQLIAQPSMSSAVEPLMPIRVSAPAKITGVRGHALVKACVAKAEVTTRRSRMVGKGG